MGSRDVYRDYEELLIISNGISFSETHPVNHAHIFAILDVLGKHEALAAIQAYPNWPLILRAWYRLPLLYRGDCGRLWTPSRKPIQSIQLIRHVCEELDEESQRRAQELIPLAT